MAGVLWHTGTALMIIGLVFMFFGILGLFRFRNFYPRLLVLSKIDTVGAVTLLSGVALRHGLSFITLKVLMLIVIILIFNPLIAHLMARSAYISGHLLDDITPQGDE